MESEPVELVTVRIAVAIDHKGHWFATGSYGLPDDEAFDWIIDDLENNEARYFITAKVRKPAFAIEVDTIESVSVAPAQGTTDAD